MRGPRRHTADARGWRWADLMRRVFELDVLSCPRCGGRLRLIAVLEASDTTARILRHLHLPTEVPPPAPARPPPDVDDWAPDRWGLVAPFDRLPPGWPVRRVHHGAARRRSGAATRRDPV